MNKNCRNCGSIKPETEFSFHTRGQSYDSVCKSCRSSQARAARAANPEESRRKDRLLYHKNIEAKRLEQRVRAKRPGSKEYRRRYAKEHPEFRRNYSDRIRATVISHYGGKCAMCELDDHRCLVIDHVNNDGNLQRRQTGYGGGNTCYRKIKVAGFPSGYQLLCANCNWRKESSRRSCKSRAQARYSKKLRDTVFEHYGLKCSRCSEDDPAVLVLDHIHDDGKAHRVALLGNKNAAGLAFYRKLIKLGFPNVVQTLCWNCNTAKARDRSRLLAVIRQAGHKHQQQSPTQG